jgi:hypothetical protein
MLADKKKLRKKRRQRLKAKLKRSQYKKPDERFRSRLIRGQRGGKRR